MGGWPTTEYFSPDPGENATTTSDAKGGPVEAHGVTYGPEVGPKDLKKYIPPKHFS